MNRPRKKHCVATSAVGTAKEKACLAMQQKRKKAIENLKEKGIYVRLENGFEKIDIRQAYFYQKNSYDVVFV